MVDDSPKMVKSFLQSEEWEEFQQKLGRKTYDISGKLVIKHDLPLGFNYLYSPRPGFSGADEVKKFLAEASIAAKKEGSVFFKIEPAQKIQNSEFRIQNYTARSLQPQKTLILDLLPQEHDILLHMHPKTRYNIRLAEKHGVTVGRGTPEDFEQLFSLLKTTAERDHFYVHDENHYKELLAVCSERFSNEIFLAKYKGSILAAAIVNFYKESSVATYLHGASSRDNREVMAPYLLHWEIIFEAKLRGFHYYDFWGIDEKRWPGVTRFKMGFGGKVVEYPEAQDIIYRKGWYAIYKLAKVIKL